MKKKVGTLNGKPIVYGGNQNLDNINEIRLVNSEEGGGTNKTTIELYSPQAYDLSKVDSLRIENLELVSPIKLFKRTEIMRIDDGLPALSTFNIEVVVYVMDTSSNLGNKFCVFRFTSPTIEIYMSDDSDSSVNFCISGEIYHRTRNSAQKHTFSAIIVPQGDDFLLADHELRLVYNNES